MLLLNLSAHDGPLHRRLYEELKAAIHAGRLTAGARVPSSRSLAGDLQLSRNTVMVAYEQLAAEGYLVSQSRAATTVAPRVAPPFARVVAHVPEQEPLRLSLSVERLLRARGSAGAPTEGKLRYDFRYGKPAIRDFPREVWHRLLAARSRRLPLDAYAYAAPAGYLPLREALSDYLRRARGMVCEPSQIVIVNGSQQGFDLAARVLLNPGEAAVVEEPFYPGSADPLITAGARLLRVPVDAQGLDVAQLPSVDAGVRLISVAPCHQFPAGVVMSLDRRVALLDWATRAQAWVIEDDYISEYRYEGRPLEALQALDRAGRVIYVGTFSKTVFPALRLAYLVLPHALVEPFLAMKLATDRFSSILAQQALTDFITGGQFERHLRRSTARNAARRRVLVEALVQHFGTRIDISGRDAGVHVLVWLNDVAANDVDALIGRAAAVGVGIYSIAPYFANRPARAGLLFGYTSLTESEIRAGVRKLAAVLA